MANYMLAVDPVYLLSDDEYKSMSKGAGRAKTTGEAEHLIKHALRNNPDFKFADVFQSQDETHEIMMHDFLMEHPTNKRGMHNMGELETPNELFSFVVVDDEWIEKHPDVVAQGVSVELDHRIDPHKLHANDGALKDGRTAGFMRYDTYKTPIMTMMPDGPVDLKDETIQGMEDHADDMQASMSQRKMRWLQLKDVYNTTLATSQTSDKNSRVLLNAVKAGWNFNLNFSKKLDRHQHPEQYDERGNKKPEWRMKRDMVRKKEDEKANAEKDEQKSSLRKMVDRMSDSALGKIVAAGAAVYKENKNNPTPTRQDQLFDNGIQLLSEQERVNSIEQQQQDETQQQDDMQL